MKNINTTSKFCQPRRSNAAVIFKKAGPAKKTYKLQFDSSNAPPLPDRGGGELTPYILHSTDVRTEKPLFFSAARYMTEVATPNGFYKKYDGRTDARAGGETDDGLTLVRN